MSTNLVTLIAPTELQDDGVFGVRGEDKAVTQEQLRIGLGTVVVEHLGLGRRRGSEMEGDMEGIGVDVG